MASLLSANVPSPFAHALSHDTPAEALAVAVGALVGVAIFGLMVALFSRRRPRLRPALQGPSADVLIVPPPAARPHRGGASSYAPARVFTPPAPRQPFEAHFRPSAPLSARAFAKMGLAFGERIDAVRAGDDHASNAPSAVDGHADDSIPVLCELESTRSVSSASPPETGPMAPVTVQPILTLGDRSLPGRDASCPSPLATIRSSSSSMVAVAVPGRTAPIGDLDFDDGPTELHEPLFDVVGGAERPRPCRTSAPPKIRRTAPTPPRF